MTTANSLFWILCLAACKNQVPADSLSRQISEEKTVQAKAEAALTEFVQNNNDRFAHYDSLKASGTVSPADQLLEDSLLLEKISLNKTIVSSKMRVILLQKKEKEK